MNLNDNPTLQQFHDLLRQHDDQAGDHVLWVRKDGEVMLSCLPKYSPGKPPAQENAEMQLRYDTFPVGSEHVGPGAAQDKWWTTQLFKHMLGQWAKAKGMRSGGKSLDRDTLPGSQCAG
jgi:hypothetical protein